MIPKFRFWYEREDFYPDQNYMCDVWKIEYITNGDIYLNDDYTFNPYTNVAENAYAKTKIYLMQSTGLKDKNGVDVFEGDYLSLISFESQKEFKGEVVFSKGSFCMVVRLKGHDYKVPLHELSNSNFLIEVLGNIYENPELLEGVTE